MEKMIDKEKINSSVSILLTNKQTILKTKNIAKSYDSNVITNSAEGDNVSILTSVSLSSVSSGSVSNIPSCVKLMATKCCAKVERNNSLETKNLLYSSNNENLNKTISLEEIKSSESCENEISSCNLHNIKINSANDFDKSNHFFINKNINDSFSLNEQMFTVNLRETLFKKKNFCSYLTTCDSFCFSSFIPFSAQLFPSISQCTLDVSTSFHSSKISELTTNNLFFSPCCYSAEISSSFNEIFLCYPIISASFISTSYPHLVSSPRRCFSCASFYLQNVSSLSYSDSLNLSFNFSTSSLTSTDFHLPLDFDMVFQIATNNNICASSANLFFSSSENVCSVLINNTTSDENSKLFMKKKKIFPTIKKFKEKEENIFSFGDIQDNSIMPRRNYINDKTFNMSEESACNINIVDNKESLIHCDTEVNNNDLNLTAEFSTSLFNTISNLVSLPLSSWQLEKQAFKKKKYILNFPNTMSFPCESLNASSCSAQYSISSSIHSSLVDFSFFFPVLRNTFSGRNAGDNTSFISIAMKNSKQLDNFVSFSPLSCFSAKSSSITSMSECRERRYQYERSIWTNNDSPIYEILDFGSFSSSPYSINNNSGIIASNFVASSSLMSSAYNSPSCPLAHSLSLDASCPDFSGESYSSQFHGHKLLDWDILMQDWRTTVAAVFAIREQVSYGEKGGICSVMSYTKFKKLRSLVPESFQEFFSAEIYLQFLRDVAGQISSSKFLEEILKILYTRYISQTMKPYFATGNFFTRENFSNILAHWIEDGSIHHSALLYLKDTEESLPGVTGFYILYITTRFFFCLNKSNDDLVNLRDILMFEEFQSFTAACTFHDTQMTNSWSPTYVAAIYLALNEAGEDTSFHCVLQFFQRLCLPLKEDTFFVSEIFLRRVFEVYNVIEISSESNGISKYILDIEELLKLLFSLEYIGACAYDHKEYVLISKRSVSASLRFIWKAFDINESKEIDVSVIHYFWKGVKNDILKVNENYFLPSDNKIMSELFDILSSSKGRSIKKKDFMSNLKEACCFSMYLVNHLYFMKCDIEDAKLSTTSEMPFVTTVSSQFLESADSSFF